MKQVQDDLIKEQAMNMKIFFPTDRTVLRSLPTLHFHSPKGIKKVLVAQLCPTLCNPMDCSAPGFSVHGILQARILEWVAIPFSRGLGLLP